MLMAYGATGAAVAAAAVHGGADIATVARRRHTSSWRNLSTSVHTQRLHTAVPCTALRPWTPADLLDHSQLYGWTLTAKHLSPTDLNPTAAGAKHRQQP